MFPQQGSGMNRSAHFAPSLPANSIQAGGIPGMPQSAMLPGGAPSTGFVMQHNFSINAPVNVQPNQNKMWPQSQQQPFKQQDASNQQTDHKHRDYLKQQQRLKAMPLSSSKGMSADTLIGNLLEKKDTFTPRQQAPLPAKQQSLETPGQIRQPAQPGPNINRSSVSVNATGNFPGWLSPNSSRLPPIYAHIWSLVCDPASGGSLVDTNKILALLLTSSLPKEVLGFIWNLATNGANVQLNQQQLYVTLALVALAQMGCTFNNLSVLNFVPTPPIPTFNMNVQKTSPDDKQKRPDATLKPSPPLVAAPIASPSPSFVSGPSPMLAQATNIPIKTQLDDDDFADDFTDFQSADTPHVPPSNVCNTLPDTAVIQPSATAKQVVNELNHSVVSKLGRSHGRSIGSRLANHTLGAPKLNLKAHRAMNNDNMYGQDEIGFSFEKNQSLEEQKEQANYSEGEENEDFSDFQTAASLNVNVDELFPKCHPKPKHYDFMLKESAIRNESDEEDVGKQKEDELLSLDSPPSSKPSATEFKNLTVQMDIPFVPPPLSKPTKELMSVEEDKYSALRILENTPVSKDLTAVSNIPDTDDFGDFVSADDMFAEIADRNTGSSVVQTSFPASSNDVESNIVQNAEFAVDDWATSVFHSAQITQEPPLFESQPPNEMKSKYDDLSLVFSDLDISQKDSNDLLSTVDPPTKWDFEFDAVKESPPLNLSSNFNNTTTKNDDDFGDFVGPDSTQIDDTINKTSPVFLSDQLWIDSGSNKQVPGVLSDNRSVSSLELPGVTLSRHGSLPSLDLNLFPTSDDVSDKTTNSQQLADWLRCLEKSCFLLQAAASTFTNITTHSVLLEVLGTVEGKNYLNNLLEVHRVTWRIQRSYQRSGHESNQIDGVLGSVGKVWSTLQTFYKLANIETAVEKDGSDEESGQPGCGVCGSPASRGVLEYGGHVYHAPCANLWLNCVDRTLPAHSPLL